MNREMTGAEMVVQALKDQGVDTVFGYPGGAVLPIYDALFQQNDIRHILVRHEQAAAHAAEGYARSTGKPGVVLVTSGPGATNAVTGMTDALMDSIPIVVLTGQVADLPDRQRRLPGGRHRRHHPALHQAQLAGEGHRRSSPRPSTRRSTSPPTAAPARCSSTSPRTSSSPPPPTPPPETARVSHYQPRTKGDPRRDPRRRRGAGEGRAAGPLLRRRRHQLRPRGEPPAARARRRHRLPAHLDADGPRRLPGLAASAWIGMLGMHGTYEANWAMHDCDFMLCVGARFDDRITGRTDAFSPGSFKVHIDIDPSSINKNIHVDVPIVGDVASVLADMLALWKERGAQDPLRGGREVVEADRALARPQLPRLPQLRQGDQAAVRAPAARGADQAAATATSPPRSASTRCGRRSTWPSTSPTAG